MDKKTFEIDSIGIEFEFLVPEGFNYAFRMCEEYINKLNKDSKFNISIDKEYYSEQIEFKLFRTNDIEGGIKYFQEAMKGLYNIIIPLNSTTNNHFVGTHIHLFINKDGVPYTKFAQGKKIPLVNYAYGAMSNFLLGLTGVKSHIIRNEISRLTRNHNILRYFDEQIGNKLKVNLESVKMCYAQFHSGTDRPKYTPVLWSLANEATGKPHSLEIRCIPNTFLLLSSNTDVANYVRGVENILNSKVEEPQSVHVDSIVHNHFNLLKRLITF